MLTFSDEIISFDFDQDIIDYFTLGACNSLAWELHKLTDWSLAIVSDRKIKTGNYAGHAFVFDSDGLAIDIMGRVKLDKLEAYWYFCPYLTRFHTTKDFQKEMSWHWDNSPHYTRDKTAKKYAKIIVDTLK